jgi:hypothetical protein
MLRIRTAALTVAAAAVSALALGLSAGPAVAHDRGHDGFGHHGWSHHALTGVVQSVNPSANTAVVTLGGGRSQGDFRSYCDHGPNGTSASGAPQVTLSLSGATIYNGQAMHQDWSSPGGSSNGSATTMTLADVHPGDQVTAQLAADHSAVRQDVASGALVPVQKLVDWGAANSGASPQTGGYPHHHHHDQSQGAQQFRRS